MPLQTLTACVSCANGSPHVWSPAGAEAAHGMQVYTMKRAVVVAALLALGGCASWFPTDFLPSFAPTPVALRLESEPPGAEARTTQGQVCRTPCALPIRPEGSFTVTFTLPGYHPETVPVRLVEPIDPRIDPEIGQDAAASVEFDPNPVAVQLQPLPPPPVVRRRPATKPKPRTAPKPAAARRPAPAPGGSAPGMIPGSVPTSPPPGSPWPAPPR